MGWLASLGREKGHAKWLIPLATLQEGVTRLGPKGTPRAPRFRRHDFRESWSLAGDSDSRTAG
jgi:hypothetical protein